MPASHTRRSAGMFSRLQQVSIVGGNSGYASAWGWYTQPKAKNAALKKLLEYHNAGFAPVVKA